jgi:hypothetical protein
MPHRRTIKNGSFGARLEELIEHFRHGPARNEPPEPAPEPDEANIHDRLFESAWRRARGADTRPPA